MYGPPSAPPRGSCDRGPREGEDLVGAGEHSTAPGALRVGPPLLDHEPAALQEDEASAGDHTVEVVAHVNRDGPCLDPSALASSLRSSWAIRKASPGQPV